MIRYFSRHPTAANLMMLALIILGLVSLPKIKRETFPEFAPPYIIASVVYPGRLATGSGREHLYADGRCGRWVGQHSRDSM